MHFFESFGSSCQNIFNHKMRSLLTLLGILIGVFAVVTMFSTVYGLKKLITERMENMGWNNSLIIYPSTGEQQSRSRSRFRFRYIQREAKPLTFSDYLLLKAETKSKSIYGYINSYNTFYYRDKEEYVRLNATNNEFFRNKTYLLKEGRYFSDYEEANAFKVCVLGYHFAETYYRNENPLGKIITIGGNRYKIIGVLDRDMLNKDGMDFNSWERRHDLRAVYIPLSTGTKYLRADNAVDYIYIQAFDNVSFWQLKAQVTQKLLVNHNMSRDFAFNDVGAMMYQISNEIGEMMKKWNIMLSAIASISLIVGGIGLFSTLLISINERMTEIGIRKSIGAKDKDIFSLFLTESIVLSLLGAFAGIFFSTLLITAVAQKIDFNFPIPIEGILLGIGFSLLIGIFSGLYPAIKAAKIDPIKAIYYFE